ncbi:MAG TPA: hypothetical protein VFV43_11465 [Limnobacter sp.]|nr:hypothetical protein [Limnobacter sp.]
MLKRLNRCAGVGLLEAVLVSALVAAMVLSAVGLQTQQNAQSSSVDSRVQITKAVKEYAALLSQAGTDLDLARVLTYDVWKERMVGYCMDMVRASGVAQRNVEPNSNHPQTNYNMLDVWHSNFSESVRFMKFELTGCAVHSAPLPGMNVVSLSVGYRWREAVQTEVVQPGASEANGCTTGYRCEKFHVALAKGV